VSATPYVDTHCHLDDTRGAELDDVLAAARSGGVAAMISVGCDAATSARSIEIAAMQDDVFATVGLHPHEARHGVDTIVALLDEPGVVAVGECGLDYYYDHSPRDAQREAFAAQILLARERDLPLVVHTRDAWDDTFDVFAAEGVPERVVFHCFTGGPDELRRCLDLGAFVSFSGIVTFRSAADVQAAAQLCPPDRLLVETDSPYLAPVPHRGRTNQPAHVVDVVAHVAGLRHDTTESVREATWHNAALAFPGIRP
jgi:TatD DNase family protein